MYRLNALKPVSDGRFNVVINLMNLRAGSGKAVTTTTNASDGEHIVLPKRIDRGPTDLLYALSRTVDRDPTAVHYKFQDDPFLIPTSLYNREQFALSYESGKKAARWIKQDNSSLFENSTAQPPIEAFLPRAVYTEESIVDLKSLQRTIDAVNVTDAILVYDLLTKKNITVPEDLKQSLLELVCFYNQADPLPLDLFEERTIRASQSRSRDAKPIVWTENCFADQLYKSIEPKTPATYNTMIRALFKYHKRDKAQDFFTEAEEKGIPLDCATYNSFIRNIHLIKGNATSRWDCVKEILNKMKQQRIRPDVNTMNAILLTIKNGGNFIQVQENALSTLAEFRQLNIEPSLETYSHLLDIYHGNNMTKSHMIGVILDQLEGKELTAQSIGDREFFTKAMQMCRYRIPDSAKFARRLDNIVTYGDNIRLLGDTEQEQFYYRHFLSLLVRNEPLEEFILTYNQLVPETYSVEPGVMEEILSKVNNSGLIEYIPKFWSDMIICQISRRARLNHALLEVMKQNPPQTDIKEHVGLLEEFAIIAWSIYTGLLGDQHAESRKKELVSATTLASIMILLCRANEFERANEIVQTCLGARKKNEDRDISGMLTEAALSEFIDMCIVHKQPSIAIQVIEYSIEKGCGDSVQLAKKLVQAMTLSPKDVRKITDLVGVDVLKAIKTTLNDESQTI